MDPVASHESAARIWGIDTLGRRHEIQLTRARQGRGGPATYPGLLVHHSGLPPAQVTRRYDVSVTTVARTVLDIARVRPFRAGVVAADSALRRKLCTREDFMDAAAECARWPGIRRARAVAGFASPLAESPLESISRAAFHAYQLPAPALQQWVTPYDRVDFLWPRQRVIGEADGMAKYATAESLRAEKSGRRSSNGSEYRVVRWNWYEAHRRPDAVCEWIREAFVRR